MKLKKHTFKNPSLISCIAVGKAVGFLFGLIGFVFLSYFLPEVDDLIRWGILLWYATLGAMIGMFELISDHPLLTLFPWWLRTAIVGAWMNFVLTFFAFDVIQLMMLSVFGEDSLLTSPFWFVAEGAIIGLIIGYFAKVACLRVSLNFDFCIKTGK